MTAVRFRFLNWLLTGGLLVLGLLGGPSLVLCVAADGQVRFEAAASGEKGCCGHVEDGHHSDSEPADCGGCVDFAMQIDDGRALETDHALAAPPVTSIALCSWPVADVRSPEPPRRWHPPPLLASLSAIRLQI